MREICITLLAFVFVNVASAQTPGLGETRPLPEDAVKQEPPSAEGKAGPEALPRPERSESDAEIARCKGLSGAPRDECLHDERSATTGASRRAEPPSAPPPQNPR